MNLDPVSVSNLNETNSRRRPGVNEAGKGIDENQTVAVLVCPSLNCCSSGPYNYHLLSLLLTSLCRSLPLLFVCLQF